MSDDSPNRRLSDKIRLALDHALNLGRQDVAGNLQLIHDAVVEEETRDRKRRRTPVRSDAEALARIREEDAKNGE